jgi:hypothetical protein
MASRRSAPQPASRPPSRPEVAESDRAQRTPHATAGWRAGAEARRAPNVTAGRCIGETGQGRCCERGSPQRAWRMPGAAEKVARRVGPGSARRAPGTAPVGPATRLTPLRPFSYTPEHGNHGPRSARELAHRRACRQRLTRGTRGTGAGHPPVALRAEAGCPIFSGARLPHARDGEHLGGLPEKRATATEQAAETPGGGRDRLSSSNAPRHRRVASRRGGATSAERDGRPVYRRNRPRGAPANEVLRNARGGCQAPPKEYRSALDR